MHSLLRFPKWLDFLLIPVFIMPDHTKRTFHNMCVRTIINIQQNTLCLRIILHKIFHDSWFCTAESIDRLVIIPNNEQIILRRCQHTDDIILHLINILELIYQHIVIFFLPPCKKIRSFKE